MSKYESASSQRSMSPSELSYNSSSTDITSASHGNYPGAPRVHRLHPQASSNLLGAAYQRRDDQGEVSMASSAHDLNYQASSSTLRSYYDPKKSSLLVSQQTSASAVRDMALRKGYPPVPDTRGRNNNVYVRSESPLRHDEEPQSYGANHPGRQPPRLDLSKLFPKPMKPSNSNLLSPNKFVSSPSQLSLASDYNPRNQGSGPGGDSNERTPRKPSVLSRSESRLSVMSSNSQGFRQERSVTGTSKMKIWKPAGGIQHWFDGLEEEDEDVDYDADTTTKQTKPNPHANLSPPTSRYVLENAPKRNSSLGRVLSPSGGPESTSFSEDSKFKGSIGHIPERSPNDSSTLSPDFSIIQTPRNFVMRSPETTILRSPRETAFSPPCDTPLSSRNFSLRSPRSHHTQETLTPTIPTKEAVDLQDSSVLSMSSSEDEVDDSVKRPNIRDSVAADHDGEIIIGKAQAYEIKPRSRKDLSPRVSRASSQMSAHTTSTSAATIDVMLSSVPHIPSVPASKQDWNIRNSHIRQPSAIPEDQIKTTVRSPSSAHFDSPASPSSVRSARTSMTSKSEPKPHRENHKLMAVTEEEQALLELMRRKRAYMAKQSFVQGFETALLQEHLQSQMRNKGNNTDGLPATPLSPDFLSTDSSREDLLAAFPTPLSIKPKTITPTKDSPEDNDAEQHKSPVENEKPVITEHRPAPTTENASVPQSSRPTSPGDTFPQLESATPTTTSVASPTTDSHASPLPSPETPGFRHGEVDVAVKVAGSEPSCNGDDARSTASPTGFDGVVANEASVREPGKRHSDVTVSATRRRRTASSGHNILVDPSAYIRDDDEDDILSPKLDRVEQLLSPTLPRNTHRDTADTFDTLGDLSPLRDSRPADHPSWPALRMQLSNSSLSSAYSTSTHGGPGPSPITGPGSDFPQTPTTPGGRRNKSTRSLRSIRSTHSNYSAHSARSAGGTSSSRRPPFAPGVPGQQNRQSVVSTAGSNYSVSDDILAAWNSLGGGSQFIGGKF